MPQPIKVLFICGRNRRRSPTAERIVRSDPRMSVRSAGTSESSKRSVTEGNLLWAANSHQAVAASRRSAVKEAKTMAEAIAAEEVLHHGIAATRAEV
jgi:predicted protein tyrosine phosphatase